MCSTYRTFADRQFARCVRWTLLILLNTGIPCTGIASAESSSPVQDSTAEVGCKEVRDDDIWLISTRHLGCECLDKQDEFIDLRVQRADGEGQWIDTTLDDFLSSHNVGQPTLFYVHGNRMDSQTAVRRGWAAYHGLFDGSRAPPTRFVIWSWPSDQIKGQLRDFRVKAARTNYEAHYFGWLLAHLDDRSPLGIVGYSFGARVTTGALHVLSGGELAGCTLPPHLQRPQGSARVVLMAAALHNYWLQTNGRHELATNQTEHLLIQYNSNDPILKRYHIVEKHGRFSALGYTGMYDDGSLGAVIEQYDVRGSVGKSHAESNYFGSSCVMQQARQVLFAW